jgi:hypothetical protein
MRAAGHLAASSDRFGHSGRQLTTKAEMKNVVLTLCVSVVIGTAGCSRPPAPEGSGRATSAPKSRAEEAKGSANTSKNMGAEPVNPGAEKKSEPSQPAK